jgi:hypothetical protein
MSGIKKLGPSVHDAENVYQHDLHGRLFTFNGSDYIWDSKNAMALAAKHHDKTGHPTWADQNLSVRYGDDTV